MNEPQTLRKLKPGDSAIVQKIAVAGELGRRLRDMGLVPGRNIQVLDRAPLKDPVKIKLMNYNLTLRNNEADHIIVKGVGQDGRQRLSEVSAGEKVRLTSVDAGRGVSTRLESMGLFLETEVEVISNMRQGPVLVSIGDRRISLGRGLAGKILIK